MLAEALPFEAPPAPPVPPEVVVPSVESERLVKIEHAPREDEQPGQGHGRQARHRGAFRPVAIRFLTVAVREVGALPVRALPVRALPAGALPVGALPVGALPARVQPPAPRP